MKSTLLHPPLGEGGINAPAPSLGRVEVEGRDFGEGSPPALFHPNAVQASLLRRLLRRLLEMAIPHATNDQVASDIGSGPSPPLEKGWLL